MKVFGYILATIGFLAGSLASVLDKAEINWVWFVPALAAGAAGVVIARLTERRQTRAQHRVFSNMQAIQEALGRIVKNITELNSGKESIGTYEMRHRIDGLFPDDMNTFVEARETIAHLHGLSVYGDLMSHFAAAERYLNRVWSASADGYIDEVRTYLQKAQEQFVEALQRIEGLR